MHSRMCGRGACARCSAPAPLRSPAPRSRSATASTVCLPPPAPSSCRTIVPVSLSTQEALVRVWVHASQEDRQKATDAAWSADIERRASVRVGRRALAVREERFLAWIRAADLIPPGAPFWVLVIGQEQMIWFLSSCSNPGNDCPWVLAKQIPPSHWA